MVHLSWQDVRDRILAVTGGQVTEARRSEAGSNRSWVVTVVPSSAEADVTIVLVSATSCRDAGAVCTADGRPLTVLPAVALPGVPAPTVTPEPTPTTPAAPQGLSATASRQGISLSWQDPDDASITGY